MKKISIPFVVRLKLFLFVLTMSVCHLSNAQLTLYSRTVLSGQTYTQISGGTVINTNAQLTNGSQDDGSVLVSLPFSFTYDGNSYNQVTFCTNGWIGMGDQTSTATIGAGRSAGNLFSDNSPNNFIAAYFADGGANFPSGNGAMVHGTIATDVYAFEWRGACGVGFSQSSTDNINYMVVLYGPASSAPGRIEILYGPTTGASPSTGRSMGIEDATGGSGHYINALDGSTTSTTTNSAWPGNGNGYRFDPPPPCSGTPVAGTIVAPASVCPTNFTMTLSGNTVGPGITYQWLSKPSTGTTYTAIAGANSSSLTTTITVPTDFICEITCTNSNATSTTPSVSIGINSFYACYCKSGLGGSSSGPSIDSVGIDESTLHNGSPGVAAGSYTQYNLTGNQTASLQAGGLYFIFVQYGGDAIGSAWLDANRNGTYEPNEWIQINTNGASGLATLRVPPTAATGLTGLRIRSAAAGDANGAGDACSNFSNGETEDYIVNVTPAPSNDIRVVTLLNPVKRNPGICPFTDIPVKAVIYNNGSNAQNGFSITAQLNGALSATNTIPYSGVLNAFTSDTVTITTYNFNVTGSFNTKAYVTGALDVNAANDSSAVTPFHILHTSNPPLVHSDSVCFGETALLTLRSDTFKHLWYKTLNGNIPFFTGDTLSVSDVAKDTVFYVSSAGIKAAKALSTTSAAGNGCSGGVMFDVVPLTNISVDSFAALFNSTGGQIARIYYRQGSFAGFETNPAAWTFLGTYSVPVTSTTAFTQIKLNNSLQLLAGNTYGIYINYDAQYTTGNSSFTNADLQINTGTGLCGSFSGTNQDMTFNGTVYYSKSNDICESPKVPVTAYAGPIPAANLGPDISACENIPLILDAGFAGGSYLWNTGDQTQTINVQNAPGTKSYWVLVDKYCTSSDTINIITKPLPSVTGISYQKAGNKYYFSAAGASDIKHFLWVFGDGATNSSSLTPVHEYADDKGYQVKLIMYNDCGADSADLYIPLGINNVTTKNAQLTVYPNPANSTLTVDVAGANEAGDVFIVNNIGVLVYRQQNVGNGKTTIDVSALPSGNYILRYGKDAGIVSKLFTISR